MDCKLPDKQYFKIGEVARIATVQSSVLRFWETEFEMLRPVKSRAGQRLYSRSDVQLILAIKHLLYVDKLTIAGARNRLAHCVRANAENVDADSIAERNQRILHEIRDELRSIKNSL